MKLDKEQRNVLLAIAGLFALFFIARFGIMGLRSFIGFAVIYAASAYYLIRNTKLEDDEKLFFSIFLSIGIVPSITYFVGFASLRAGIVASAIILFLTGYIAKKFSGEAQRSS